MKATVEHTCYQCREYKRQKSLCRVPSYFWSLGKLFNCNDEEKGHHKGVDQTVTLSSLHSVMSQHLVHDDDLQSKPGNLDHSLKHFLFEIAETQPTREPR